MKGPYDDIIALPHPTSRRHPRMPAADRAAQFAPFAALTGYAAAVKETARETEALQSRRRTRRWPWTGSCGCWRNASGSGPG